MRDKIPPRSTADPRHTNPGPANARVPLVIDIPGVETLRLTHLVLDLNGTLATDGDLIPGTAERVRALQGHLDCHLLTADTLGTAARVATELGCRLEVVGAVGQDTAKTTYVAGLGRRQCVAIGNGANDAQMLFHAALGICVVGPEGAASTAAIASDVICSSINDALDLLLHPIRLAATLRR